MQKVEDDLQLGNHPFYILLLRRGPMEDLRHELTLSSVDIRLSFREQSLPIVSAFEGTRIAVVLTCGPYKSGSTETNSETFFATISPAFMRTRT